MKNHTSTLFEDCVYVFGGFDGNQNSRQMRKLNPVSGEWSLVESSNPRGRNPVGRNGHSATLVNGNKIYIIGGWFGVGPLGGADVHVFDFMTYCWTRLETFGEFPGPCNMHTANFINEHVFLFRGGDGQSYLNDLHLLNVETNTWSFPQTRGRKPPIRANHCSAVCQGELFIFGGWNGTDRLNDLYALDSHLLTWREIVVNGIPPTPRAGASLNTVGNSFLLLFGGSGSQSSCFNDVHTFCIASSTWKRQDTQSSAGEVACNPNWLEDTPGNPAEEPEKRAGHTACLFGNRKLIVVGGSFGAEYRNTVFELDVDPPPSFLHFVTDPPPVQWGRYFDNKEFSDVTFWVGNQSLPAHRVCLSAKNAYFRALLSRSFSESTQPEIALHDVNYSVFRELIQFLYLGEIDLSLLPSDVTLEELFQVADRFVCAELRERCELALARSVKKSTVQSLLKFAQENHAVMLEKVCCHFEKWGTIE